MQIDAALTTTDLNSVPATAANIEAAGYDGVFSFEGQHDPKDQRAHRADADEDRPQARNARDAGDVARHVAPPELRDEKSEEDDGAHEDERRENVQKQKPVVNGHERRKYRKRGGGGC